MLSAKNYKKRQMAQLKVVWDNFLTFFINMVQNCSVEIKKSETEEETNTDRRSSNGDREMECVEGGGKEERVASTFPLIKGNWSQVTISWSEDV